MPGDAPSQGSSWSSSELGPTVAEACLIHFAGKYQEGCRERKNGEAMPRWMDEHSFACILICQEHGDKLSHNAAMTLANCRSGAADSGGIEWVDVLPWDIAIELLGTQTGDPTRGIDSLVANLTHGQSNLRAFMFELAWFVRSLLPVDDCARRLLRNVADTLSYWDDSVGLCSFLFENMDDFWSYADSVEPEACFDNQYHSRLDALREHGIGLCRYKFIVLDSQIRKLTDTFAYGLRCCQD